jgi:hypothetical protein
MAQQPIEITNPYYVPAQPANPPTELPAPSSDLRRPSGSANVVMSRAKVILNPYLDRASTGERLTSAPYRAVP